MAKPADRWTNPSVIAFAQHRNPIEAVTEAAKAIVMQAFDQGWEGPPFDPIYLADLLKIQVTPNDEVRDARLVMDDFKKPRIEYNPSRSRGRLRYNLAHELAHTLFEDWSEEIRHRANPEKGRPDAWQLEALCNIAAAEFLMPAGTVGRIAESDAGLKVLLHEQRRFDVSTEALLIRSVHLREEPCAMFCSSMIEKGHNAGKYQLDYIIGSRSWPGGIQPTILPETAVVSECTAIGYTAEARESWVKGLPLDIECVGIPPYPGGSHPRVAGLLHRTLRERTHERLFQEVVGDATEPRGTGPRIIAHIVNDKADMWGGGGFAASLRRKYKGLQDSFREWAKSDPANKSLGRTHFAAVNEEVEVASMVAQHGYGESTRTRVRYAYLQECLVEVAKRAVATNASVHMPRIGCGLAGGSWDIVYEIVRLTLLNEGISVVLYERPGEAAPGAVQHGLGLAGA